jgi:hypothetical protein
LACVKPPTTRAAISIHSALASAVATKLMASPEKPISSTGRRPKRSDSAPSSGAPKKLASAKANMITPYQCVCAAGSVVNSPTSGGNTGTIRPIDSI